MKRSKILIIAMLIFLHGCSTVSVERPDSISLSDALKEVVEALNEMSNLQVEAKHGMAPAEVTVTFNITAGKKTGREASVDIVPTGIVEEITGLSYGWSSEVTETRGNSITIKFRSILFASEKELVGKKTPEEINEIYKKLQELGWNIKIN